ncbi:hypothetical protein D3C71_1053010 [compost metagenome]
MLPVSEISAFVADGMETGRIRAFNRDPVSIDFATVLCVVTLFDTDARFLAAAVIIADDPECTRLLGGKAQVGNVITGGLVDTITLVQNGEAVRIGAAR